MKGSEKTLKKRKDNCKRTGFKKASDVAFFLKIVGDKEARHLQRVLQARSTRKTTRSEHMVASSYLNSKTMRPSCKSNRYGSNIQWMGKW